MCFSLPSIKCSAAPSSFRLFRCLNCAQRFDYRSLGSSRKLGGAAERLMVAKNEFVGLALNVIERHSNRFERKKETDFETCCEVIVP